MKLYDYSNPLNPKLIEGVMKAIEFGSTDGFAYNPGFTELSIKRLAEYSGINTINLTWVEYVNKNTGQIDRTGRVDIEKNIEIVAAIAHANGLNISLKPYFQIEGKTSHQTNLIQLALWIRLDYMMHLLTHQNITN